MGLSLEQARATYNPRATSGPQRVMF